MVHRRFTLSAATRVATLAAYLAAGVLFVTGPGWAVSTVLLAGSLLLITTLATDPRIRQLRRAERQRDRNFYALRAKGRTPAAAWNLLQDAGESPSDGGTGKKQR